MQLFFVGWINIRSEYSCAAFKSDLFYRVYVGISPVFPRETHFHHICGIGFLCISHQQKPVLETKFVVCL